MPVGRRARALARGLVRRRASATANILRWGQVPPRRADPALDQRRRLVRLLPMLLALAVILAACQPGQAPRAAQQEWERTSPRESLTLTIALAVEPKALVLPSAVRAGGDGGEMDLAVHQWLARYDERGVVHPVLASELPSR